VDTLDSFAPSPVVDIGSVTLAESGLGAGL
jgi:hypothetical protein